MAWDITERFPAWGESGEMPPVGFFYEGGDQVNEKHLDALWNGLNGLEEDVQAAFDDIDSDSDGVVDKADALAAAAVLDGDLLAGDGELLWDESQNYIPQGRLQNDSLTVAGNSVSLGGSTGIALGDLSNVTATGEGSGNGFDADTVDGQDYSDIQNWVNNNADVPNADYADNAGQLDGSGPSAYQTPSGVITMWSGSVSNIPNGWTLCDGTGGTPDLRGRFIVGGAGSYAVGDTGGEEQVTLTEAQMPSHSHTEEENTTNNFASDNSGGPGVTGSTTGQTSTEGNDEPHENRPPYYALAYIMKV